MLKVIKVICNVLLGIVVAAAVALAGVLGLPVLMGDQLYAVQTSSMAPTYPVGSIVAVQPVQPRAVAAGDVITFTASGFETPVTHRVMEVDSAAGTFITKGDNNQNADFYPVSFENLQGRVRFGIPLLGKLVARLQTAGGWLAVAWGLFIIVLLLFLPELVAALAPARHRAAPPAEAGPGKKIIYKKASAPPASPGQPGVS